MCFNRIVLLRQACFINKDIEWEPVQPQFPPYLKEACKWIWFSSRECYSSSWVNIRLAFLSTRVKCVVLSNPFPDLILGNVKGVIDVNESMLDSHVL